MTAEDRSVAWFGAFIICITAASFMIAVPLGLFMLGMDFLMLAIGAWAKSKVRPIIDEIVNEGVRKATEDASDESTSKRLHKMAHDLGASILGISREQAEQYAGPAPSKSTDVIVWYRKAWEAMQEVDHG